MRNTNLLLLSLLLTGCASSKFIPYSGQQQDWPVSPGAFSESDKAIPVYHTYPDKPYSIIGYLDTSSSPFNKSGLLDYAAKEGKARGADAVLILDQGERLLATKMPSHRGGLAFPITATTAGVVLVKFK